jgi:predicted AlkP superfamily pyrophosphatase or phosphodiesterase
MIRLMILITVSCALSLISSNVLATSWPAARPKLIVFIVIDQFRADYLSRFENRFSEDGFKALMKEGAYFPYGEYDVLQSMTGPGHATVLTGAYPYQMGIPINDWYDQETHRPTYCVFDATSPIVGANSPGVSPRNLVGSTLGDELKNAGYPSHVVSLALKDRAAVLLGGHRADLAFWFDNTANHWVSSHYYLKDDKTPKWMDSLNSTVVKKCPLEETCGTLMTVAAFKAALTEYKMGHSGATDLIAVSFSSHDYAGHIFGPNAPEMEDMTISEDQAVSTIRKAVRAEVGSLKDVVFVLTGDHGVAPSPRYLEKTGIETGRIDEATLISEMEADLKRKFGKAKNGKWIAYATDFNFYLDEQNIAASKADLAKVEAAMKSVLLTKSYFAQVFTRDDVEKHLLPPLQFERQINKTDYKGRSGHVIGIQKPFYVNESHNNANHMTGYTYDRTVPILFSGLGIKHGVHSEKTEVIDIAPTLSYLSGVVPPALSEGRVLGQILKP